MRLIKIIIIVTILPFYAKGQPLPMFKAHGDSIVGLTAEREQQMKAALHIFELVMNDTAFQRALLNTKFVFDVPNDPNINLSTLQIVSKIYAGKEFYKPMEDNVANVHWIIVKKRRPIFTRHPALGEGAEDGVEIFTYTWFFDSGDIAEITGHIAHEWSHKIGFEHAFHPHPGRDDTVPYAFGYLVRDFAKKYISN